MNARTAKLLNRIAADRREQRELKRLWHMTPRPQRHRVRKMLETSFPRSAWRTKTFTPKDQVAPWNRRTAFETEI